jgi:signal transduction histidine kinase
LANPLTEIGLTRRDGRLIPVGVSCSPLRRTDGGAAGLVAIFQDLTERKRVEEQLRRADRLAALGQLAANIAHEVRNPLAAISGAVEVLREDLALVGPNRELLEIVLGEAHRLKLITGQFLDFAKPKSLLFRPCAIRPLVQDTLRLLDRSGERHPNTTWDVTEAVPDVHVLADADQLRQVVWNLCLNAIQAMPQGGRLSVSVRLAPADAQPATPAPPSADACASGAAAAADRPSAEWVEIAFRDTGRGIPPEQLQRVFDPFFTTRPSGTGLGLAIAKKILESMGGQVAAESQVGSGTIFRIWLRQASVAVGTASRG